MNRLKRQCWEDVLVTEKFRRSCFILLILIFVCCASRHTLYKRATFAVWDLDDVSPTEGGSFNLRELLSAQIMQGLKEKDYSVVERERLIIFLEELQIGTSSLIDESTRLHLGKLVGAHYMLFGGYLRIENTIRIDLRLVEVETGRVVETAQKMTSATDMSGVFEAAREAALGLLD
ncbi:MAG: FlgO family outer membrane protein [bacterium]